MKQKLKLYNTLEKKIVPFVPIEEGKITMYICGPTVYDSPHIGHARTYISFDIIRRILTDYYNYDVCLTMNITDIDDKIITRASEKNIGCDVLTKMYENEFFKAMDDLRVKRPDFVTRVTDYVDECVDFIKQLETNGYTYESNGSVYFNLTEYKKKYKHHLLRPEYKKKENTVEEFEKENADDFVLWKASKKGEPIYESKWGPGRPGWHIECSAMATSIFGNRLDIHAGGIDLAFPHHENEIAQCQGHSGKQWVNYFLHTGHLNINGCKMSKSLKNFLTISDILKENNPVNLRILFLQHLWNKDMNFDFEQLREADSIRKRIYNFISKATASAEKESRRVLSDDDRSVMNLLDTFKNAIDESLSNNINTAKSLTYILDFIGQLNSRISTIHSDIIRFVLNYLNFILSIFGINEIINQFSSNEEKIANLLANYRNDVRTAAKQNSSSSTYFSISDKVRESLKEFNYTIDDSKDNSLLRKTSGY